MFEMPGMSVAFRFENKGGHHFPNNKKNKETVDKHHLTRRFLFEFNVASMFDLL